MPGYSKRSLVEKLGIKPGDRVYLSNAPKGFEAYLGDLPEGAKIVKALPNPCKFIHLFVKEKASLQAGFSKLKKSLASDGLFWVSWPKGASGIPTDVNENIAREIGIENGLVDVKVCAVDDIWSGLKFVYRLKDRPSKK